MKLKTIINTKSYLLTYSLFISVSAHLCAWVLAPQYDRSLFLNDIMTAKVVTVQDHFVEIKPELKPTVQDAQAKPQNKVQAQKKPVKKLKRKRTSKRRKWKRRTKKSLPKAEAKTTVKRPLLETKTVLKNSELKLSPSAPSAPSIQTASKSISEPQNEIDQGSAKGSETQVAQRISKKDLRGILRGYYKNLNSLMSTRRDYPRSARRLGLEGTVLVEMVINNKGQILSVKLAQSSGHDVLDQAAIAQVHKIGRVPSIPNQIRRNSMTFRIPFEYRLQS